MYKNWNITRGLYKIAHLDRGPITVIKNRTKHVKKGGEGVGGVFFRRRRRQAASFLRRDSKQPPRI